MLGDYLLYYDYLVRKTIKNITTLYKYKIWNLSFLEENVAFIMLFIKFVTRPCLKLSKLP